MALLTVVIFPLIGYTITLTEGSACNTTIPHGLVHTCEDFQNGRKCRYSCDSGYQTNGLSSLVSCNNQTGMWTLYNPLVYLYNSSIVDEDILCTTEDGRQCTWNLPNADLDLSCDNRPGSTCTYQCRTPYHSIYSPPEITCQETNLTWTHEQLCSVVRCAGSFRGGRMYDSCDLYEGSTCTVQCDYGYIATNDSLQVTCLSSGRWNHNLTSVCQKVSDSLCPDFIPNGWISSICTRRVGDTCSIGCDSSYTLISEWNTATCLSTGKWDIDISNVCLFQISDSLCPDFIPNGWISSICTRRVGDTCSIGCDSSHTLISEGNTATCLSTGKWDIDISNVCLFRRIPCPPVFNNGYIDYSCDMYSGSVCKYKCNQGYSKNVEQQLVKCLGGKWSPDLTKICVKDTYSYSSSVKHTSGSSSNRVIIIVLPIGALSAVIFGGCLCRRSRSHNQSNNVRRSPRPQSRSSGQVIQMYSVGQCRTDPNLNRSIGAQNNSHAHDASPPLYTELM